MARSCQQTRDLYIGCLRKILIPLADRVEIPWCHQRNYFVCLMPEFSEGSRRARRYSDNQARGILRAQGLDGGARVRRRASGRRP